MGVFLVLIQRRPSFSTRHINFTKRAFVFGEFPFTEETQRAHAKGENGRNVWGCTKEGRCVKDSAIATEGSGQVDFGGEAGVFLSCIDGKWDEGGDFGGNLGFEYQGD